MALEVAYSRDNSRYEGLSDRNKYYVASGIKPSEFTYEDLPEGKEDIIIEMMRKGGSNMKHLMRLNDQQTIDKLVSKYFKSDGAHGGMVWTFAESASPYILDELATALYVKDEDVKWRTNPNPYYGSDLGMAHEVAKIMLTLIATVPEFSQDVQQSAQNIDPHWPLPLVVTIREWWEQNREALLAEQFDQVGKVELVVPDNFEPFPNTIEAKLLDEYRKEQEQKRQKLIDAKASEVTASTASSPNEISIESHTESPWDQYLWWILGSVATIALTLIFVKNRHR